MSERRLAHLFAVRDAHPADQQAAAIAGVRGLRGVELESGVQLAQFAVAERGAVVVETTGHPHRRIGIEEALFFTGNPLRAADQNMLVAERKQIRALPHIARVAQAVNAVTGDFALAAPLMKVRGAEQQHLTALLPILRPQHHVPAVLMPPDFRVADVAGIALRQRQDRAELSESAVGVFRRQALPRGSAAIVELHVAGIAQGERTVVIHRAAGVAAVAVVLFIRHQRNRLMPPAQQIV